MTNENETEINKAISNLIVNIMELKESGNETDEPASAKHDHTLECRLLCLLEEANATIARLVSLITKDE